VGKPSAFSTMVAPTPALRPYINGYIGYRLVGFPPGVHRGLPSRHLTFIVSLGEPIDVILHPDRQQRPEEYGFVLGGLQDCTALIAHHGHQEGIAIELTPIGCRALLGMPARALWNMSLEADTVLGRVASELRERLHLAPAWPARFAACDHVLMGMLTPTVAIAPEVREAWRALVASGGSVPVTELARDVGWSRRHLAERFGDEFGLSPKFAGRVIRFERARRLLQSAGRPSFADVAAVCGYYDQPHLNRDFVELAGCPPGEWLANELPSVQDDELAAEALSVA
jgi:AraC-like DNA-binding protein